MSNPCILKRVCQCCLRTNLLIINKLFNRLKFSKVNHPSLTVIIELHGCYPGTDFANIVMSHSHAYKSIANGDEGTSGFIHFQDSLVNFNFPG